MSKLFLPFAGVDGEGGNLYCPKCHGTGYLNFFTDELTVDCPRCLALRTSHEYLLLRAGDHVLETGKPLRAAECLDFLSQLPHDREYVSFFFDYDVAMILRELPEERLKRLLAPELRTGKWGQLPVEWGNYELDYRPHAEFKVRRLDSPRWATISDVGTFFQCSFVKALTEWGIATPEQLTDIQSGKGKRSGFVELDEETRQYNGLECELLAALLEKFRNACAEIGYIPRQWQGPGRMAATVLARHGIPKGRDLPFTNDFWARANAAYYGGRFETTAVGPVQGPIYQYDINSAYPAAMLQLPCLVHGEWRRGSKLPAFHEDYYLARIKYRSPQTDMLGMFPHRTSEGNILFPLTGHGWYWSPEIEAARRHGIGISYSEVWTYKRACHCKPFSFVNYLYQERMKLGKTEKGRVLKLAMNSLYGKMAQSIGQSPYGNPVWAGLITSITRAQLVDLFMQEGRGKDCFMLATDGLFLGKPRAVVPDKTLGGWDLTVHEDGMFIVQPGLYFAGTEKPKTRGVPLGKVMEREDEFRQAFANADHYDLAHIEIPLTVFLGLRLSTHRGTLARAGQWEDVTKTISFDWSIKRGGGFNDLWGFRTMPYANGVGMSIPYDRTIGGLVERDYSRELLEDSPEWADLL